MKKTRTFIYVAFSLLLISIIAISFSYKANAEVYSQTTTTYYSCKAHTDCTYITFESQGNSVTGEIYDRYFSNNYSHWPNAFRYDNVWSYTVGNYGYAKGSYTLYSSLITQWVSLAFQSISDTIVHIY